MKAHLTIVRHGSTEWMEKGLLHGRSDSPLSTLGLQQVHMTAESLRGRKFDSFFSSPTGRAWQTAEIIAGEIGQTPHPLDLLQEQDFGVAEGTAMHYFPRKLILFHTMVDWFIPHFKGGEPLREMHQRVVKALNLILDQNPGGSTLVISHHGLISMILKEITGKMTQLFYIPPAAIIEVEIDANRKGRIISGLDTDFRLENFKYQRPSM